MIKNGKGIRAESASRGKNDRKTTFFLVEQAMELWYNIGDWSL